MTTEHQMVCGACGALSVCVCSVSADHRQEHCFECWDPILGEPVVATCADCGGKYRPAGGPCIHEHPKILRDNSSHAYCGTCGVSWRPGHTCIPQPAESDVRQLAAMLRTLDIMGEIVGQIRADLDVALPESWEAV